MPSTDYKMEQIEKKLNELIELVKKGNTTPKVENHTHHHYPTYPNWNYYPHWQYGTGTTNPTFSSGNLSGVTWTDSTNDTTTNGPVNPT